MVVNGRTELVGAVWAEVRGTVMTGTTGDRLGGRHGDLSDGDWQLMLFHCPLPR
ncbi:hypothetical protein EDD27_9258 [Nonomuraea polychroma]|uniref:Uncharacterized protein n=1 Tax=Nonomuraea polychroma TaxID=46176 RepID=A0A438MKX2_9ACTN|nr:hypothetical protein [Nonomuraea polychroma]RVX46382.1 hypothetical protein EDD27_9258 [Nonomuraea polychroma]